MSIEFKAYYDMGFIFTDNLNKVLLSKVLSKLDGFLNLTKIKESQQPDYIELSQHVLNKSYVVVNPANWISIFRLCNSEKLWQITIYKTYIPVISNYNSTSCELIECKKLPDYCMPSLHWIIPMCNDLDILSTTTNQILMA